MAGNVTSQFGTERYGQKKGQNVTLQFGAELTLNWRETDAELCVKVLARNVTSQFDAELTLNWRGTLRKGFGRKRDFAVRLAVR